MKSQTGLNFYYILLVQLHISAEKNGADALVNNSYKIKGDFYINPEIGLGGAVELNRGDNKEIAGNTYTAAISGFFTKNISLSANFGIFKADSKTEEDNKLLEVKAALRI